MRKSMLGVLSVMMGAALALAGCGTTRGAAGEGSTVGRGGANLNADYTDALPVVTQLAVGTLRLEETDLAVSPDQARQFVPLWQAYRTLLTSQTSAQQERDALVSQIEETMTADQIKSIAGMKLTAADMQTVFRGRNPQAEGTPGGTPEPGQRRFSGGGGGFIGGGGDGFPGGGFAGGDRGGFFGGLAPGQTPNPQAIETLRAERGGTSGQNFGINPGLVGVLVQFLQQKSGVTPSPTPTVG